MNVPKEGEKLKSDCHIDMEHDWRQKVLRPVSYRIGNRTVRVQAKFVIVVAIIGILFLCSLYAVMPKNNPHSNLTSDLSKHSDHHSNNVFCLNRNYNSTYPASPYVKTDDSYVYKIAIVSDLDTNSKSKTSKHTWTSVFKLGKLTFNPSSQKIAISFEPKDARILSSSLSLKGRGMELSELVSFNGRIYTVDDRTGVVYQIVNETSVVPWVLLNDGNGMEKKGFKCEWATVKDRRMYVGGLGKVWTSSEGEVINHDPQWIKMITSSGEVQHVDWRRNYKAMMKQAGIEEPGYIIHESGAWSDFHKQWFFLPRRASNSRYNEKDDEKKGTNLLFRCSEDFIDIKVSNVGTITAPTHGFSSFKFIPNTNDGVIVALKSEEDGSNIASYITAFTVDGKILLPETKIGDKKFEGIEFI